MASAANLKKFCSRGDNPPRNSKTNNAGIKLGESIPHPPGVGAYPVARRRADHADANCIEDASSKMSVFSLLLTVNVHSSPL
jgi:hypothetical protein